MRKIERTVPAPADLNLELIGVPAQSPVLPSPLRHCRM
jgi:hypothetical protein